MQWRQRLRNDLKAGEERIWIHVASLGEFEQARPLMERLKRDYPQYKILVTFFSPSGYEIRKHDARADYVCYLPEDTAAHARDFIALVNPRLVMFIKYEFWHHYLDALKQRGIPVFLVAAAFMPDHVFFHWYGGFFRNMLKAYTVIFVQDSSNQQLLEKIGFAERVVVSGDTRYDRVMEIAASARPIPEVERFKKDTHLLIAGSTWPKDEELLVQCIGHLPVNWKLVVAPHEVNEAHIRAVLDLFGEKAIRFSEFHQSPDSDARRVLVIDNIGMLSSLYAYGALAYIGGGFALRGLHNILEPAAFGNPVLFGPQYKNFVEAIRFVDLGLAFPVADAGAAIRQIQLLTQDLDCRNRLSDQIRSFMQCQTGAADRVIAYLAQNNWL